MFVSGLHTCPFWQLFKDRQDVILAIVTRYIFIIILSRNLHCCYLFVLTIKLRILQSECLTCEIWLFSDCQHRLWSQFLCVRIIANDYIVIFGLAGRHKNISRAKISDLKKYNTTWNQRNIVWEAYIRKIHVWKFGYVTYFMKILKMCLLCPISTNPFTCQKFYGRMS